jgi:hypothetical protein
LARASFSITHLSMTLQFLFQRSERSMWKRTARETSQWEMYALVGDSLFRRTAIGYCARKTTALRRW